MPDGIDPAEMLERSGPAALSAALRDATPLAVALLDESIARYADRLDSCEGRALAATAAGEVIAALPIDQWQTHMAYATRAIGAAPGTVHAAVFEADQVWTADPCGVARHHHAEPPTNDRPAPRAPESGRPNGDRHGSAPPPPANADRAGWINLVRRIDPRLTDSPDWPGLANGLDRAHAAGYDVNANLPRLATRAPLPDHHPARALHYRLVQECEAAITPNSPDTQIATAEANSTASRARLTAEGRRSDNVAAARPQAARPPTAEPHPQPQSATEVRRPHDPSPTHPKRRR